MGKKRHAKILLHTAEILRKSTELMNARKYDEATPLVKSGLEYMQKHLGRLNINKQMLTDYDVFFKEKYKSKELDFPQVGKIIDEYINIVKSKFGDDTTGNLAMYIYFFQFDSFLTSWGEVLKPYRIKTR